MNTAAELLSNRTGRTRRWGTADPDRLRMIRLAVAVGKATEQLLADLERRPDRRK